MRVKTLSSLVAVTGMLVSFAAQAQEAPAEATPAAAPETTPAPVRRRGREDAARRSICLRALPVGNMSDGAGIGIGPWSGASTT